MTTYDFNQPVNRLGTNSLKWDHMTLALEHAPADALPLWVADMDFPCAAPIIQALHERVDRLIFGYSVQHDDDYYQAVTGWFQRRFSWAIDPGHIFYSPGVVPALGNLLKCLSKEGDGIIIQSPVYYPFAKKILNNKRVVVNNPLHKDENGYSMDYVDLENKLKNPQNKGLIFCSPHNPVGRVWREDELKELVRLCQKYDKWIISDEIHCDIIRQGQRHFPLERIAPEYKQRIFTCTAPSKSFNLAGLQLSNIIINDPLIQAAWLEETPYKEGPASPNPFAIVATIAAYNQSEDWLDQVNIYLDENVRYVEQYLAKHLPLVKVSPCEGTYLMWLDFNGYGLTPEALEEKMLQRAKVALDEGYIFGEEGRGFERINIACPRLILTKSLERICEAFA